MKWECKKCGACCEILPVLFYGQPCEHYDAAARLCRIYETRPEICRVSHALGEEATRTCCDWLREFREGL